MPVAIAIGLIALAFIALVVYVATRPPTVRYERSAQINAPAAAVFSLINNFHEWAKWSPWEKKDPNLKRAYSGAPAGPGAVYAWSGNANVGEGRMTVMESKQPEFISIKLEFLKPFKAINQARFQLTPSGEGTHVVWSMEGENLLIGKIMSLFINMDKMIGKDFEVGLANLNAAAQAKAGSN